MKIGEYEQMMSWLTRPESSQIDTRQKFANGTPIIGTNQSGTPEAAQERLKSFVDDFVENNKRLPGKQEIRNLGNFDFYTIKKAIDSGKIEVLENLNTISQQKGTNEQLLKLSKDKDINNIFKSGKTTIGDIKKVKKVIGNVSNSVAADRLLQLASIYSETGAEDNRGLDIKPKFKDNAAKILKDSPYTGYIRNMNEALIGQSVGDPSIKGTKSKIIQDADYIKTGIAKAYDIDEPLGVASSVNRGSTPYGIYGQIIDASKNKMKVGWDSRKSQLELDLQNAIKSKDKKLINDAVKKFNKEAKAAENLFNKDRRKGSKKIVIPEVSLDKPSKTNANYKNLNDNYKKAFNEVYANQRYSFKIPANLKPITQIKKDLKDPKILSKVEKAAEFGDGRLYSNPMADPGLLKQGLKDMGKFGKYAGQIALSTPAGAVLATKGLGGTFDPRTTEGRLTAGAEAAFAPGLVKGTEAFTKNKILQRVLNLGLSPKMAMRAARVASPIGIATLAGEGIYQGGKYMLERKKLLESLTDEQRDDLLSRERSEAIQQNRRGDPEAFSGIMAANGGLIYREGFEDGSKDPKMNRRTFMKTMAGLASIPVLGKFIKPAAKVAESAAPVVAEAAKSVPPYFFNLVAKIKKFGEDVSQKYATQDREVVTKFKDYELTENVATGEQTIQRMKVLDDDSASYYGNPLTEETYMNYKPSQKILLDESNPTGGVQKTMPEYEEGTAYIRSDREYAGDIVDESFEISDDVIQEGTKFEDDFMDFQPKKKK